MSSEPVYLDNNATTRVHDEVLEALLPWLKGGYGNPSSAHCMGQPAARAIAKARSQVARLVGARSPREIVFTSGGTESINSAIRSGLRFRPERRRLVTSTVEHSATANPARRLVDKGFDVVFATVDHAGRLDTEAVLAAIDETCAMVTLLWGNNETGAVVPLEDLARIGERAREVGAAFHLDAVQVAGKQPICVQSLPVDMVSISAHKFHGPKGVGAIWVRGGVDYAAHVEGGTQEEGRRGGTLNTPGIVGLGAAAALAADYAADGAAQAATRARRDRLEQGLVAAIPEATVNGAGGPRVANTSNISFPGVRGDALLLLLSELGLCVSTGSACSTGKKAPSHVLLGMGVPADLAGGSIRLSLSRFTTDADIDAALERIPAAVVQLREMAPSTP
ncbi:cysteine desulfurase family protein [Engelhardtia mirabilis]|uniref:cysteine desulfurase n=1 Tax=Engelhardtia mirabilis TaxID=2528011 RepID=A0A518BQ56_9BACT|nr:Cysteine desulfurase [Planctomycetes bacterium Pla133]QDV03429.1 Cysteine desulfurase [Planctomycetes bacterium Pla86]